MTESVDVNRNRTEKTNLSPLEADRVVDLCLCKLINAVVNIPACTLRIYSQFAGDYWGPLG